MTKVIILAYFKLRAKICLQLKVKVEGEITLKYGIDISHELNKEVAVLVIEKFKVYEKKSENV